MNVNVLFVSDLHLGHRTILKHTKETGGFRGGETIAEHDDWVINQLLSVGPNKRTLWYMLGDVAMEKERLNLLDKIPGRKILLLGNHDLFATEIYLKHFEKAMGGFKKYGIWITHIPVHPLELRGHPNIHGHSHHNVTKEDARYLNASIEWLPNNLPISLDEVRARWTI